MAIDERRRSQLYERLAAFLGHDEASTMFELLPPAGADAVTSADLRQLGDRLEAFEQRVDDRFVALEQRVDDRFVALEQRVDDRLTASDDRLLAFEHRLDQRLDAQHHELVAVFRGELAETVSRQTRAVTVASVSTALSVTATAVALAQLLG